MPNARYAVPFFCPHCPHQLTVIGGTVGRGFADTYLQCNFCHAEFKSPTIELEPRNAPAAPSLLDQLRAAKLELLRLEIEEKKRHIKSSYSPPPPPAPEHRGY